MRISDWSSDVCSSDLDEDGVVANVAAAKDFLGGLNATINCAGILGAGRVLGREAPMPLKNFSATVMVNLVGSFNVAKAAAAQMQHNETGEDGERGAIVNTASVAAYEGQIGQAAYSASKGGVVGMTLPMARELARSEEHTSELQSLMRISYAVFCLKKKTNKDQQT